MRPYVSGANLSSRTGPVAHPVIRFQDRIRFCGFSCAIATFLKFSEETFHVGLTHYYRSSFCRVGLRFADGRPASGFGFSGRFPELMSPPYHFQNRALSFRMGAFQILYVSLAFTLRFCSSDSLIIPTFTADSSVYLYRRFQVLTPYKSQN